LFSDRVAEHEPKMTAAGDPVAGRMGEGNYAVIRRLFAEAFGTCLLVFFGVGAATLTFGFHPNEPTIAIAAGVVATALAFGLALLMLVYAIGPISGCHVNPAVTLGFLIARRISLRGALAYWAGQFAGGIIGALLLWAVLSQSPLYSRSRQGLGVDGWGVDSSLRISMGGAFLTEVILTMVLVFVVLLVTGKTGHMTTAGLAIGLTLTVDHLIGIPITGTSVNPARALAPALIVGGTALNQVWLFIVAPLVGAVVAALAHRVLVSNPAEAAPGPDAPAQVPGPRQEAWAADSEQGARGGAAGSAG
jgi:aquaporin Z